MSVYAANLLRELVAGGHDVVMISQYRNDPAGSAVYGGGPPPAAAPLANGALAATSAAGAGAPRVRKISRPAMRALPRAPVNTQRTRSPARLATPAARPQLEQNWAPAPRGAPQPAQVRATRLAPQVPQNFPEAGAPQAAQTLPDDEVMDAISSDGRGP